MRLSSVVVFAALGIAALACSSAPPSEDPFEAEPAPDRNGGGRSSDETSPLPDPEPKIPGQPTPACEDACDVEGERRCKAGATDAFEACLRGEDGCLAWSASPCVDGGTCDEAGKQACFGQCPPAGREACPQLGTKRCADESLEQCAVEAGCPVWKELDDCGAKGKICDGSACVTQCVSTCATKGARRCVSGTNNYETCKEVQPGCLKWQAATSCGSGKVCQGAGSCVCSDQCTTLGASQCISPDTYRTCTKNAAGCKVWSTAKACARSLPSPGCFAYPKACFGQCADQCTTEGQITCTGSTSYVKCKRSAEQCLVSTPGTCKTSQVCFASPSVCANGA